MALNLVKLSTSFLLLIFVNPFPNVESRTSSDAASSEHPFTKTLQNLKGVHKGQTVEGVGELKSYLKKFGYLNDHSTNTLTNYFDEDLESALKDFQTYHNLYVTGLLDSATIERMSLPRCGVPDITPQHKRSNNGLVIAANYSFFPGSPKWGDSKRDLTYTYKSSADTVSMDVVRQACKSAFQSWSKVTDFTFTEVLDGSADVVIGFHSGDHGDGYPFDGPGRVLAHTFAPEDGRLHCDADEKWTNNPSSLHSNSRGSLGRRRSPPTRPRPVRQIDLETVALHEIGHLIGLGHSSDQDAVMYPYYGGVRRNLRQDDVDGIQALYAHN